MSAEHVYTVEEARALLPQVRAILLQLAVERHRAGASHQALHRHLGDRAHEPSGDQRRLESDTAEHRTQVRSLLEYLESLGVVVRDVQTGLVDFPTVRDGDRAWLCWRLDDPDLGWWHTTREGYASRRPLP